MFVYTVEPCIRFHWKLSLRRRLVARTRLVSADEPPSPSLGALAGMSQPEPVRFIPALPKSVMAAISFLALAGMLAYQFGSDRDLQPTLFVVRETRSELSKVATLYHP